MILRFVFESSSGMVANGRLIGGEKRRVQGMMVRWPSLIN